MANKTIAQMSDGAPALGTDLVYILRGGNQDFNLTLSELAAYIGGTIMNPSSTYHVVSAVGTNAAVVKNASGVVTGAHVTNNTGYPIYVKLFNKATAPVLGTDVPQQTFGVQAGTSGELPIAQSGLAFSNGIAIAITKGIADADTTAVAANDCVADIFYQ